MRAQELRENVVGGVTDGKNGRMKGAGLAPVVVTIKEGPTLRKGLVSCRKDDLHPRNVSKKGPQGF